MPWLARRSPVGTGLVDAVGPQDARVHAVVRRRLVQPDERVRVEPVTTRAMAAVDEDDLGVRMAQQRVHERHSRRPRSLNVSAPGRRTQQSR